MKEWTFYLRQGVQFHFGYGEFTARDVVHSHSLMLRQEAIAAMVGFWRSVEEIKVINDYHLPFAQIWREIRDCVKLWACMRSRVSLQNASMTFHCCWHRCSGWVSRRC